MADLDLDIATLMKRVIKNKEKLLTNVTAAKRNLVVAVFTDIVNLTPQFSGNLASNWKIEVAGRQAGYSKIANYRVRDWRKTPKQYKMGDSPATTRAFKELNKVDDIRWNSRVSIVNYTPYAEDIQNATVRGSGNVTDGFTVRPVNTLNGEVAMVNYARMKYKNMRLSTLINKIS